MKDWFGEILKVAFHIQFCVISSTYSLETGRSEEMLEFSFDDYEKQISISLINFDGKSHLLNISVAIPVCFFGKFLWKNFSISLL